MAAVGDQLAHYRIEQLLGAGGMGEVYVAFDQTLERRVALKLLPSGRAVHADARLRMLREARAASALAHPGIVTVYEIGEVAGRTYIAMELVEGETLAQLIARRGALPPAEAIALFRQVCDAIVAAHAAGILHRDLKPANLMFTRGGGVKVLDFGLSKRVGAPSQPPLRPAPAIDAVAETVSGDPAAIDPRGETVTPELASTQASDAPSAVTPSGDVVTVHGARMGTPGWAAPELMAGEDADVRSDVFSLGVVLHELVTGQPPFPWTSWEDIRLRILDRRYRRASEIVDGALGDRLDVVIARALAPKREERYATVADLIVAVSDAARPRRARWPIFAGVGGLAIAGVVVGVVAWPRSNAVAVAPDAGPPGPVTGEAKLGEKVALTTAGGCAFTPSFGDDRTVLYDLTLGSAVDLWSVDLAGGAPVRLTDGPGWEWRAAPGRAPGHAVFLLEDPDGNLGSQATGIGEVDLVSHRSERINGVWASSVATAGGDLYYLVAGGSELRRVRDGIDELVVSVPDEGHPEQLAASPDGKWIAITGPPPDVKLMLVEIAASRLTVLDAADPGNTRPAFSTIAPAIYYLGAVGVRRIGIDGKGDELVGPNVRASGGLAVSPDGRTLVYSACDQRSRIVDAAAKPAVEVVAPGYVSEPVAGPRGWLAWIKGDMSDAILMVRRPDGKVVQLTTRALGRVSSPAFDAKGATIAFGVSGGDHPGLQVMGLDEDGNNLRVFGMSGNDGDNSPLFVGNDLVFARADESGLPHTYRMPAAGGPAESLVDFPTMALAVTGNGDVVLGMGPSNEFEVVDVRTRKITHLKLPGDLVGLPRFSPNGDWICVHGDEHVWRLHLDRTGMTADQAIPELVFDLPEFGTAGLCTVTDDGHVLVAPSEWTGELYKIGAPGNTRW